MDADVKATIREALDMAEPYVYTLATDEEYEEWSAKRAAALDVDAQGQGWQPVADGRHTMGMDFAPLHISCNNDPDANTWIEYAGDNVMLAQGMAVCRLAPHAPQVSDTPAPSEAMVGGDGLIINEYQLQGGGPNDRKNITLRRMVQRDGKDKWAIYDSERIVLSKEYEDGDPWEYEPLPSSRDDEYLARCRYDSIDEALAHWQGWLQRRPDAGEGV